MSSQTIITKQNLPTGEIIAQMLTETAVDLLKELKFEIGNVCTSKMRNILRLSNLHCNDYCYISESQKTKIRETLIRKAITNINEL